MTDKSELLNVLAQEMETEELARRKRKQTESMLEDVYNVILNEVL